jgi:NAD(P)-dependent dehydrogenase (short-subunit alcohol dehydrogenase family)
MGERMHGKTVLITGANQGIGKASAIELARQGARVVLVSRNEAKGLAALEEVKAQAKGAPPELLVADLASLASVRRLAGEFMAKHDRLDVLLNNAGLLVPSRRVTVDGIEETFAVNHLAPFVLTSELLGLLKASGPSRIVNVSSEAHRRATMNWDDLEFRKGYGGIKVYSQSKLANVLFTYELARRLTGTGVTANCLHPGVIASGFGQTYKGVFSVLLKVAKPFLLTPEQGSRTSVYLASSAEVEGVSGKYFDKCKAVSSNKVSYDEASWSRLWEISLGLTAEAAKAA